MQGREKKSGKIYANVFVWREDILDWLNAMAMLGHNLFPAYLSKNQNSWQINLPARTEEAVCSSTARLRWSTSVCVLRSDGYTFVIFFGCVCAGGSISGECCDVSKCVSKRRLFWVVLIWIVRMQGCSLLESFQALHVNAWFCMMPWVLSLRDVFKFGNSNWGQQIYLRKQCYIGKLSREVRARTTRERREGLYESYRAVSMVDGSPRAPSLAQFGKWQKLKNRLQTWRYLRNCEFVWHGSKFPH